ncbi:MAG: ComF family protein [Candidatus Omnitrophota bacterium]
MLTVVNPAKDAFLAFLNLIYPKNCQGCGKSLDYKNKLYLCESCFKTITINKPPFCIRCGHSLCGAVNLSAVCGECMGTNYSFDKAFSCCNYDGLIKELIHNFKYKQNRYLVCLFDELMTQFIKTHMDTQAIDMVVPVPLHKRKIRERGFDQSLLISSRVSNIFNLPLVYNALKRNRYTAQQTHLSRFQRMDNIKGAFSVKDKNIFNKKAVLLVDDVATTFATADECASVLKKAGTKSVFLLTLARGL